jgi:hypothetical protein
VYVVLHLFTTIPVEWLATNGYFPFQNPNVMHYKLLINAKLVALYICYEEESNECNVPAIVD